MAKLPFKYYNNKQPVLFPERVDQYIPQDAQVRMVDHVVDRLNLSGVYGLYSKLGPSSFHPRMMLKIVIYGYMCNVFSSRKIEERCKRDLHFFWLSGSQTPDHVTINRFRNLLKTEINRIFTQLVVLLAMDGMLSLDVEYIDGTKIESKANKYTFVWRSSVEKNRERLLEKIRVLLGQIDDAVAQEMALQPEKVEFTPEKLTELSNDLKEALAAEPEPEDKEEKARRRERKRQTRELEKKTDKLAEYDARLGQIGAGRNSMSKTDPDATFMRTKDDITGKGLPKPCYNVQIGTHGQFITDYALGPERNDSPAMIPFLQSYLRRYGRMPNEAVADSGYGSEENYCFMKENGVEAYVKYNWFHIEHRPRYKPSPFSPQAMPYDADGDFYVCPAGRRMCFAGTRNERTRTGYTIHRSIYQATYCRDCPMRRLCYKGNADRRTIEVNHRLDQYKREAARRLTSEKGVKHRGQRCIEPEAVFGQIKQNMGYRRFRHFGIDKVTMDFAFLAIAFNIKKLASKRTKWA